METDYISRQMVLELLGCMPINPTAEEMDELYENVKMIDTADVRPVIPAQWIALDIYRSEGNYKCSHCEQPCYVPECMGEPMYAVCPNCGAKMGETP